MRVHFTGACGRAIGSLALELKLRGWDVSASDSTMFPPMDQVLRDGGLHIHPKFAAKNVPPNTEVLVRGTQVRMDNIEVRTALRRGIPVEHMAGFLQSRVLHHQHRVVVAGTNGKTTTTSMLAFILDQAGLKPDYLIGGTVPDLPSLVRFRSRRIAVLEGDEFIASADDPQPKFLFYKPTVLLLTNVLFDHAEVFTDFGVVKSWFEKLVALVPADGLVIVSAACPAARALARQAKCKVLEVGKPGKAAAGITKFSEDKPGSHFFHGGVSFHLKVPGKMNARNAAMAAQAALHFGVKLAQSSKILARFCGVRGRMEEKVSLPGGRLFLDEGYHPGAVRENLAALRQRFPRSKLIHIFQPRSTGGREGYILQEMPKVLALADVVLLIRGFDYHVFPGRKFSNSAFASAVRSCGPEVQRLRRARRICHYVRRFWEKGAVVLCSLPPGCEALTDPVAELVTKLANT